MQLTHVGSKNQDMLNAAVHTNPNTITSLGGVARQTAKLILLILKLRKVNYAYMHSSA